MSWILAFLGFAALVILHEAGHFFAAKAVGMRVERFALFFPPLIARVQARRDGVRDRRDPARRLREDHRHEPGGGDPAGARAPRLLPPAGVEADRRDRRRPGREHRARVRDPRPASSCRAARSSRRRVVGAIEQGTPAAGKLKKGDVLIAVDGKRLTGDTYSEQVDADRQGGRRAQGHAGRRSRSSATAEQVTVTGNTFYDAKKPSATASASATTRRRASQPAGPDPRLRPRR